MIIKSLDNMLFLLVRLLTFFDELSAMIWYGWIGVEEKKKKKRKNK